MSVKSLEMFKTDGGYTVIVDGLFADELGSDEALAVVASAIFGSGKPMFVRNYEDNLKWNKRYRGDTFNREPIALLEK